MPTYEYHCPKCKATYELRQGFDADTTHKCEECGKGVAKRVLYAPPVVFKGSGWYVTDSKSKSAAVTDSKTEAEQGAPAKPSESAGKSEPASKPEPAAKTATSGGSEAAAAS